MRHDLNERTISHKFAEALQDQFPGWHVDCEYNRNHDLAKILDIPVTQQTTSVYDTKGRTVYPDIIIHCRGSNKYNLLVIEIKKSMNPDGGILDRQKLEAFLRKPYRYKHGLFIKIPVTSGDLSNWDLEWFPESQ